MKATRFVLGVAAAAALACGASAQVARIGASPGSPTATKQGNPQQSATFGLPRASGLTPQFPAGLTAGSGPATGASTTTTSNGTTSTTTTAATSPTSGNVVIQNPNATVIGTNTTTTTVDGQPVTATPVGGVVVGAAGNTNAGTAAYAATNVMGAGAAGGPTLRQGSSLGGGPFTAAEVAASFMGADANGDRELTRAEATRLSLMPYSFEEMDLNHDGVVTRFEYEEALRR